jgi:DNA-binding transcriptional regulator PaaX
MGKPRTTSALRTVLRALIPYTKENLQLSFSPNRFFNELEKKSGYAQGTLRNALTEGEKLGLIKREEQLIQITRKGLEHVKPFVPTKLARKARLMIIFDIPESRSYDRKRLRKLLKEWNFAQVQRSVWISSYDYKNLLVNAVEELKLESCVEIFECARLYPR